jgi:hypothetical protein
MSPYSLRYVRGDNYKKKKNKDNPPHNVVRGGVLLKLVSWYFGVADEKEMPHIHVAILYRSVVNMNHVRVIGALRE